MPRRFRVALECLTEVSGCDGNVSSARGEYVVLYPIRGVYRCRWGKIYANSVPVLAPYRYSPRERLGDHMANQCKERLEKQQYQGPISIKSHSQNERRLMSK
jgi:hypothetical protein